MKAVVVDGPGKASIHDIPEFKLRPDYIKVKVHAVALNPTDWKHIDHIADAGAIVGCDTAGVVEEVGPKVKYEVKVGDRVAGITHGCNVSDHEHGGFAEHNLMKDGMFFHIPDTMSFEDAASLPVGVGTCGQAMYQSLGLPTPAEPAKTPFPVLIYGGSTATGTLAIQLARLSGLQVLTTASAKNHELLTSLGADKCFDYNDPECGAKIRDFTNNKLRYVLDCIALKQSFQISAAALSSSTEQGELHYSALLPPKGFPRKDVKTRSTMLYTAFNETYVKMGRTVTPDPKDNEFVANWFKLAQKLLKDGQLKPHPIQVGKGFDGVLEGLDKMRKGEVSAKKLVYTIA